MAGKQARLIPITGATSVQRRGHVVFVHGLMGGGASSWKSRPFAQLHESWPGWMAASLPDVGVWVADYPAGVLATGGIAIEHRAFTLLNVLSASQVIDAPIVFICHSLGGLVVKETLRLASRSGDPHALAILKHMRGAVFLGTPHAGSIWADRLAQPLSWMHLASGALLDLRQHREELEELHAWYDGRSKVAKLRNLVVSEAQGMRLLLWEAPLICDEDTSAPKLAGAEYTRMEADHTKLSKPRADDPLIARVNRFVEDCIAPRVAASPPADDLSAPRR